LDKASIVYVTDTMNNRVEIFDADGQYIGMFGQHGDGPGYFARPKGIAIDSDGHIWVADAFQDRLQVFNREGQLLTWIGGHGHYPGQFEALVGVAIDKQGHVFTTEQYPGRMQMFQYVTDAEAAAEKARREAAPEKTAPQQQPSGTSSQKDGPSAEVQSSAAQQAAKSFWLSQDSREENKAGEGLLAQFSYLEVNRSKRSSVLQHELEVCP